MEDRLQGSSTSFAERDTLREEDQKLERDLKAAEGWQQTYADLLADADARRSLSPTAVRSLERSYHSSVTRIIEIRRQQTFNAKLNEQACVRGRQIHEAIAEAASDLFQREMARIYSEALSRLQDELPAGLKWIVRRPRAMVAYLVLAKRVPRAPRPAFVRREGLWYGEVERNA